ncbi:F-box domain-containing protein [Pleurotus pulmonarius]
MHQLPTELRGQICSILRNDNEIHTLRNIALTCRAFEEPALDSLWSILPTGLSPLFRCVTNHCVAKVNTEKGAMLEELDKGKTTDALWPRFFQHARRVRVLTLCDDYPAGRGGLYRWSESSMLRLFQQKFPGDLILPNLQEFISDDWTGGGQDGELLDGVIGPNIQRLRITLCSATIDSYSRYFLPAFLRRPWKALNSLHLYILIGDCPETSCIANTLLCAVPPLQTLCVGGWTISADALSHIASWPELQELRIDKLCPVQDELPSASFPSLLKLIIQQSPLSSALTLIAALSGSPVWSLTVNVDSPFSGTEFRALANLINTSCSVDHLQYLKITDHRRSDGWLDPSTPPESLLDPLFIFSKLVALYISVKPTILLNHSNLASIASSWPKLWLLKITNPRRTRAMSNLHDLLLFAEHCRDLKYLYIGTLSSSCVRESRGVVPVRTVPHQNLQTLCLNSTPTSDVDFVAKYLHSVFPQLRGLIPSWEGSQWDEALWSITESELRLA